MGANAFHNSPSIPLCRGWMILALAPCLALAQGREPAQWEPFPGYEGYVPYEDVLDHCALALVGRVLKRDAYQPQRGLEQPEVPGHIELDVQQVLRGDYTNKIAHIIYGSGDLPGLEKGTNLHAFLCLRTSDGKLRLAGDPPQGGGWVSEGPVHLARLIEAAKDPAKAYESQDMPLKMSAAYRLALAWAAKPLEERPAPPAGLVDTLMKALWAYQYGLGHNADAAAEKAIDTLFAVKTKSIWDYPPEMKKGRRSKFATDVGGAWERTQAAVRQRRAERANLTDEAGEKLQLQVALLIEKLGSDAYVERQAAQDELVKIGKPALKRVQEGIQSANPRVAAGCRLLAMLISKLRDFRPETESYVFDLDLAEPLVPAAPAKPATGEPATESP